MGAYIQRLLLALDILVNVALFGEVETISSRCAKRLAASKQCRVCGALCGLIDRLFGGRWKDHCKNNRMATVPAKE